MWQPSPQEDFFDTAPCGARATLEEIILDLNLWGEEERKRIVLASFRKRADILYPFKWKYIVLVFNKFVGVIFVVIQDFIRNSIIHVAINNHIILFLYDENIYI